MGIDHAPQATRIIPRQLMSLLSSLTIAMLMVRISADRQAARRTSARS